MRLRDLDEIAALKQDYDRLSGAMRQCERCFSQWWDCSANRHCVAVNASEMDAVFTKMRAVVEAKLRVLGVTDFDS